MTLEITEVRNAASLQADNLRMEVEINHPQHGWIPYGVDPSDTDTTINNDVIMALIGTGFTPYVAPTQVELDVALAVSVRNERNELLLEVDAISSNPLRWAELDAPTQALWATYRLELLDVPQQTGFPQTVVWPTKVGE
jgi:hypothetical protein